jgi:hypothetical protein
MTTRRAHPAVTFFGTLISRSFSFVCVVSQFIFSLSVQDSFFVYRFAFSFTFGFRLFRVFFRGFHLEFSFVATVPAILGRLEKHTLAPKFKAEWLYASRLSSCGLSFIVLFFFFLLSFSFNSSLLLLSSGNRTAKLVPIPFCSRDLPESYLLLFFSPTFFLHPLRSCGK